MEYAFPQQPTKMNITARMGRDIGMNLPTFSREEMVRFWNWPFMITAAEIKTKTHLDVRKNMIVLANVTLYYFYYYLWTN